MLANNIFLKEQDYTIRVDCGGDNFKRYNSKIIRDKLNDLAKKD